MTFQHLRLFIIVGFLVNGGMLGWRLYDAVVGGWPEVLTAVTATIAHGLALAMLVYSWRQLKKREQGYD